MYAHCLGAVIVELFEKVMTILLNASFQKISLTLFHMPTMYAARCCSVLCVWITLNFARFQQHNWLEYSVRMCSFSRNQFHLHGIGWAVQVTIFQDFNANYKLYILTEERKRKRENGTNASLFIHCKFIHVLVDHVCWLFFRFSLHLHETKPNETKRNGTNAYAYAIQNLLRISQVTLS